ncbi:hypothetical protein [Pseudoduganella sp. HUAS MS19]
MNTAHRPQPDRLYQLLPALYRQRDADQGYPLRALLQVISEQVDLLEADIGQLYDNWFIETCEDWVVPYIGDLIGYRALHTGGVSGNPALDSVLIPRRDVAHTVRSRRGKGTLAVLETLARDVAGWPGQASEFFRLLAFTQAINHLQLRRARSVDLRDGDALELLGGPFNRLAHGVDVRRISSPRRRGQHNIPCVGVFVWRLRSYSITMAPARCYDEGGPNLYHFSALGNDTQLFTPQLPGVPQALRRRPIEQSLLNGSFDFYGEEKCFQIWVGMPRQPIPPQQLVAADLTDWNYRPQPGQVAVDPVLGRIAFPPGPGRRQPVWVSYHYGFPAPIGGGEYPRVLSQAPVSRLYRVGEGQPYARIGEALTLWQSEAPAHGVIELTDSGVYVEPIHIELAANQTLQLRAASGARPVIRILDWQTSLPDSLVITGAAGSRCALDGLLVTGRSVQIGGEMAAVTIRHSTLVAGWGLHCDCEPRRPAEPSLELINAPECLTIEHSILGIIQASRDEVRLDPATIRISDSIIDAASGERIAIGAPQHLCAHVDLSIARSTVFGRVQVHAIVLAENTIFDGTVIACRRQKGCVRFSYLPAGSRTPRRYRCQPDLVLQAVEERYANGGMPPQERDALLARERKRVIPQFNSVRYGTPAYCQLADDCAPEITAGAADEAEMGVYHDLFQAQRLANLRIRLDEHTPAGMDVGVIFAS